MSSGNGSHKPNEQHREKFAATIQCECMQVGTAIWEEDTFLSPEGPSPVLVEVSSGFYLRVQKKDISKTEIICGMCESIVRD